jgi:hypothetical protein
LELKWGNFKRGERQFLFLYLNQRGKIVLYYKILDIAPLYCTLTKPVINIIDRQEVIMA